MNIIVAGLTVTYQRAGRRSAPTVLVLHGWGDNAAGWAGVQARLAERYDVILPDLPGFGGSQTPSMAWDLNEYGQFAANFLAALKLRHPVHAIIGHSIGGAIAVRAVADSRLQADKLVLLACAGLRSEYRDHSRRLRLLTKTGKYLSWPLPTSLKSQLRRRVYKALGAGTLVKESLQETYKRIITDDIQASAVQLRLPTLLVYGEADEATPVAFGRILHSLIDGSNLEVVGRAGHFVHRDQSDTVTKLVEEFIA